jgi:hypothetical protein
MLHTHINGYTRLSVEQKMTVGSYTSYLGYPVDGSMARAIKVTYETSPLHVRFRYNLLMVIKNEL